LFQCNIQCGDLINKGQIVGTITDPFGEFKETLKAPSKGYVVGLNNNPVVNAGDAIIHVGMDNLCKINPA
jgi:predicted deacylase